MHGRLKVKTTKEQEEERRQKRAQKVKQYRAAYSRIVEKRQAGEKDDEGLLMSQHILEMIPDIHSLWNYRREILEQLKETVSEEEIQRRLESERFLTETCLRVNPKSYGAWHHRHWIMDAMPKPDWQREIALCTKFLNLDERNFHCWDYRRFVVGRAAVPPERELAFTDEKIAVNFSNYSCWHYRSKLLPSVCPDPLGVRPVDEERHRHELELVQNAAFTDPSDQSAWFYQRWLLGRSRLPQGVARALVSPGLSFVALVHPVRAPPHPDQPPVNLQVIVGAEALAGSWRAADGQRTSSVWVFTPSLPLGLPLGALPVRVCWTGDDGVTSASLELDVDADGAGARAATPPQFGAMLSPALSSVMTEELDACAQLLEFDPDSKWTLLTSALLMQTIDRNAYEAQTLSTLDGLAELDYQRASYYKDLRSRFVVEYALERQQGGVVNVDLTGLSLTSLYHAPLMSLARHVNLNDNHLRRPSTLTHLAALQCCESLTLDRNELSSLSGWVSMPSLVSLSVQENALDSVASLASLASCPSLRSLDVRGNPIARGDPGMLRKAVLDLLPGLSILNGEQI